MVWYQERTKLSRRRVDSQQFRQVFWARATNDRERQGIDELLLLKTTAVGRDGQPSGTVFVRLFRTTSVPSAYNSHVAPHSRAAVEHLC